MTYWPEDDPRADPQDEAIPVDAFLSEAVTALELVPLNEATTGDLAEYAQRLDMTRRIIEFATHLRNHLEVAIAEAMPTNVERAGGLRITRERATRSNWVDSTASERMRADIEHLVATKLALNPATGDVDPQRRNIISYAIHELWDVLPAPSAMKAGARRFGLSITDYRNFTEGYTIKIGPDEETPNA